MTWNRFRPAILAAVLAAALAPPVHPQPSMATQVVSVRSGRWSDGGTWSAGAVPSSGAAVTIAKRTSVEYDLLSDRELASLDIQGVLTWSRQRSTRLDLGNIYVRDGGILEMGSAQRPIPAGVSAEIRFVVPPGATFTGGDFAPGDVGLWVFSGGRWDIHGAVIAHTWAKLARAARAGETVVTVREDLSDWPRGGVVIVSPTSAVPADDEFEERTVTGVRRTPDGSSVVSLSAPLIRHHDGGGAMAGEIALLSRNVRITSKYPDRPKAHTIYQAGAAGGIAYAEFKELGTLGVLGRYPIHFHMMADSSRGMAVRGVSIWRSDNHFLNVHGSNGITVEDTVGYDAPGSGFFIEAMQGPPQQSRDQARSRGKDERAAEPSAPRMTREEGLARKRELKNEREQQRQRKNAQPSSDNVDLTFVHNFAAKGTWRPGSLDEPHRVSLFWIASFNAVLIDNVSVGARGRRNSSGFHLAEFSDWSFDAAPMVMLNNEAHSNADHGFFAWTNNKQAFDIVGFRAWRNGQTGMAIGAYNNRFRIHRAALTNNRDANAAVWVSRPWIQDSVLAGSAVGLIFHEHTLPGDPGDPGLIVNSEFRQHTVADVSQDHRACESPQEEEAATSRQCAPHYVRFVRPQFRSTRALDFGWHENAHSWMEILDWGNPPAGVPGTFRLTRKDRAGGQYSPVFDAALQPLSFNWDAPPTVELTATVGARGMVRLQANASDDRGIAAVEFLADGAVLRRLTTPPYEMVWTVRTRFHRGTFVYARAVDTAGSMAYSHVVRLVIPSP